MPDITGAASHGEFVQMSAATVQPINKIPPDAYSLANSWNGLTSHFIIESETD